MKTIVFKTLLAVSLFTYLPLAMANHGESTEQAHSIRPPDDTGTESKEIEQWTKNYKELIKIIKANPEVGDCSVSLSGEPGLPKGAWNVTILRNPGGSSIFEIIPPKITGGRTQVIAKKNKITYRQADSLGWTNMNLQLKHGRITKIEFNKTFPNGEVYGKGFSCGM